MSVYAIGNAALALQLTWTIMDFAQRSQGPHHPKAPSLHLAFLSGRQHHIAVFCEILSDDGEKNKSL
jgi:hypothetical protein